MILDEIVAHKRAVHADRTTTNLDDLVRGADQLPKPRALRLRQSGRLSAIAEFKRRSPSAGAIAPQAVVKSVVQGYAKAGARALSILTDGRFFGGQVDDLIEGRAATALPVLRKDFLLDERDLVETRLMGADVALLIVRLLDDAQLSLLVKRADQLGLSALVEVHTEGEAERAVTAGAQLIGVNHRDLDTLAIDLDLSRRIGARLPMGVVKVGESGLRTRDDVARMRDHGMDAVLIGEQLMRAPDPGQALAELLS